MVALTALSMTAAVADPRILVHGHRGARAVMPENSLPAFEYAIAQGVDVLELDLAVTRDNVLVVSHDPRMNPAFCTGPASAATRVIREMTLAELQQWDCGAKANAAFLQQKAVPGTRVPTLDQVLSLAPRGRFEFNIETKIFKKEPQLTPDPETFSRLLVEAIRKHKLAARCMIQSFDERTLIAAAKLAPEIRRSALYSGKPIDLIAFARAAQATILSPHYTLTTPEVVKQAHEAGMPVVPWTANTPADWDKLIEAKADAIISDDPAALIAHLRARGLR
ncbi:MAG: glycerophosphodiester phosphodiesterase [Bryobacterales bacterium]|nr:glycerophosphodiester phosphodiesterase [Bryobacterales bacterium]